jgi:hypothetical protein
MRIRDGDSSDPKFGMEKSRIRDQGSEINIPDPQHCVRHHNLGHSYRYRHIVSKNTFFNIYTQGRLQSLTQYTPYSWKVCLSTDNSNYCHKLRVCCALPLLHTKSPSS